MSQLDFLYEPVTSKHLIDFVISLITIFANVISDSARFKHSKK
jgi:hypothetical protein